MECALLAEIAVPETMAFEAVKHGNGVMGWSIDQGSKPPTAHTHTHIHIHTHTFTHHTWRIWVA